MKRLMPWEVKADPKYSALEVQDGVLTPDQVRDDPLIQIEATKPDREKLNPLTRLLVGAGAGAAIGGGIGALAGPGAIGGAVIGGAAGAIGEGVSLLTETGLEGAGMDPERAYALGRVAGAMTGGGAAVARAGLRTALTGAGVGAVSDVAAQTVEHQIGEEAHPALKMALPLGTAMVAGHLSTKAFPKMPTGFLQTEEPVLFGDQFVGYRVRQQGAGTELPRETFVTREGQPAARVLPVQDGEGYYLKFLSETGEAVAEIGARSPGDLLRVGQAKRFYMWEDYAGRQNIAFSAQAPGSGKPVLAVVTPEGTLTNAGRSYKPTLESPLITPEVDPTPEFLGFKLEKGETLLKKFLSHLPEAYVPGSAKSILLGSPMLESRVISPVRDVSQIKAKAAEFFSPDVHARAYFGYDNPTQDANQVLVWVLDRRAQLFAWSNETLQGVQSKRGLLEKELMPIFQEYMQHTQSYQRTWYEALMKMKGATQPDVRAALKGEMDRLARDHHRVAGSFYARRWSVLKRLGQDPDNSDIRIALALDGEADRMGIKLTDHEKWIVGLRREQYAKIKEEMKGLGLETLDVPYVHRPYVGRDIDIPHAGMKNIVTKHAPEFLQDIEFPSRIPDSVNWWPSIRDAESSYIRKITRVMGWKHWDDKWGDVLNQSDPQIRSYYQAFREKMTGHQQEGFLEKLIELYRGAEYMRFTGYSLSTAVKHAFKLPLTAGYLGYTDTVRALGTWMMSRLGKNPEARKIQDYFLRYRMLMRNIAEESGVEFSATDKGRQLIDQCHKSTFQPTKAVEGLEHALSLFGGIMKAADRDFNFVQWKRAYLDMVSFANFRGGTGHPLWMSGGKSPSQGARIAGKVATIFQWTPHRIFESYGRAVGNVGESLVRLLKGQTPLQTQFGENWFTVATRMLVLYGTAEAIGQANGLSFFHQFMHAPYTAMTRIGRELWEGGPKIKATFWVPPAVDWASHVRQQGPITGSLFHWGKTMAMWKYYKYLIEGDYPDKYYTSPGAALLGIAPAQKK